MPKQYKGPPHKRKPPQEPDQTPGPIKDKPEVEGMRLNKYVAHAGVCSRRQAAEHIKNGQVTVNGKVEPNPAYQVQESDEVRFKGDLIKPEERKVYLLLNKPRGYITTTSDERGRKTVLDLVGKRVPERIFPVGRLDRETTGLLLLTNDGDLAKKLAHPSHEVKKTYHVALDKEVPPEHIEAIKKGLQLEDGPAPVDAANYVRGAGREEVMVELHIGRNRIVRRIFGHLGYEVKRLDRVYYAGLTKKDLPRGFSRHLTEQEIIMLKHFI